MPHLSPLSWILLMVFIWGVYLSVVVILWWDYKGKFVFLVGEGGGKVSGVLFWWKW